MDKCSQRLVLPADIVFFQWIYCAFQNFPFTHTHTKWVGNSNIYYMCISRFFCW